MTKRAASEPVERFLVDNERGHHLAVRLRRPATPKPGAAPAVLLPGYGMNSFIFGFHPSGESLEEYLAARGIETWVCDLRGQGQSTRTWGDTRATLRDLAVEDVGAVLAEVVRRSATGRDQVNVVGCSMGAALAFGHVAVRPEAPVRALVSLAGAVTWVKAHPLVRAAFASPTLAGAVKIKNTRAAARVLFPTLIKLAPWALSPYLRAETTDASRSDEMVQTVEDPTPELNREVARWIKGKDLVIDGVNVTHAMRAMRHPMLCVLANQDGIVPPETARAPYDVIGSTDKELVCVGDRAAPFAHGDLFVGTGAQEKVFSHIARFLARH
ncbi:MAG: alpha/beta fold hydrolase [Myxococcales bacterium]|jgi:pimeloyl-ACP methyl ester carboxylesterase|nr:alpha/beta fold hydrolase [Myxococcales bacterium]